MENKEYILNELQELSPVVASINNINVFVVPDGYFSYLPADIMLGIKTENGLPADAFAERATDLPAGYFDTLAGNILQKIKTGQPETAVEEISALSPMLYNIQNKNLFEVPQGYFEQLSDTVLSKVLPQQPKVIKMQRRSSTFFKYAVAAAFTGVMALGVFKFTNQSPGEKLPEYVTIGRQIANVDAELAKISDADIIKYLEESGTDVKAAYVANSIDESELPSQEDYLLDDQALDKYLNSINLDDLKN